MQKLNLNEDVEIKKILVIKYKNIGDVLLTTPLLYNLKKNFPAAIIDIAINKETKDMITLNPSINNILIYDRNGIKKLSIFRKIYIELKNILNVKKTKYDIVINMTKGDRGTLLALISGAPIKIGYKTSKNILLKNVYTHTLPLLDNRHIVDIHLDPIRLLNKKIYSKQVSIFWEKKDELPYDNFIHIHPVSRWFFKCINDTTMAKIIDFCEISLNKKVIITSGPEKKEIEKINIILSKLRSQPINLSGKLTLKQTAALNKKAKLFIGVDTAIMHISAANNTPTLAFFGPSKSCYWGPWNNNLENSKYFLDKGNQKVGIHKIIQSKLECIGCELDGCNSSKISNCLQNISFHIIKKEIRELL